MSTNTVSDKTGMTQAVNAAMQAEFSEVALMTVADGEDAHSRVAPMLKEGMAVCFSLNPDAKGILERNGARVADMRAVSA